jgi:hypothetical protein
MNRSPSEGLEVVIIMFGPGGVVVHRDDRATIRSQH